MDIFEDFSDENSETVNNNSLKTIIVNNGVFDEAVNEMISILPDHYISPDVIANTLTKLGKPAAAQKLLDKLPATKRIRSGDLGEILGAEYINNQTNYMLPIKRLRWKDHREMAMRGDDVIGLHVPDGNNKRLKFLKTEAKSRANLGNAVMTEARKALDSDDGRPQAHALAFVSDRLREMGNIELADKIDKSQLKQNITKRQVAHLLFTFSGNNPTSYHKTDLENYDGGITQLSVGLRIQDHQNFIASVYEGVNDGDNS